MPWTRFPPLVALVAVGLTLSDPDRFADADRYGGFVVGLIVISVGVRVALDTAMQLMDTMPDPRMMDQIRAAAAAVPGALRCREVFRSQDRPALPCGPAPGGRSRHDRPAVPRDRARCAPAHHRNAGLGGRRPGARRTRASSARV